MIPLFNSGLNLAFQYPIFLFFIFLIPLFILIYFMASLSANKKSIIFPNFEALQRTGIMNIHSKNIYYLYLFILVLLFLILALAKTSLVLNAGAGDYSYVIAMDNSNSMNAEDLSPNRLEVSKTAAKKFISDLPLGVKVGILSFSGDVQIISNLDNSRLGSINAINDIEFSDIGGTNLQDAIYGSYDLLKEEDFKTIIFISDGQINLGNFSEVIDYAVEKKLVIHTIAIGTLEGGDTGYGFISKTDVDAMKSLAFNTQGKHFVVNNTKDMDLSFEEVLNHISGEYEIELSVYFLILSIILITFYWISYNFRFKTFP